MLIMRTVKEWKDGSIAIIQTVASRFGGKYAKKVLVTANTLGEVYMERAKEMGIYVRQ